VRAPVDEASVALCVEMGFEARSAREALALEGRCSPTLVMFVLFEQLLFPTRCRTSSNPTINLFCVSLVGLFCFNSVEAAMELLTSGFTVTVRLAIHRTLCGPTPRKQGRHPRSTRG